MRDDAADLLALLVLFARVDKAAGGASVFVAQLEPRESGGEEPLTCKRERNTRGIDRDPAPSPLLGDVGTSCQSHT